MSCLRPALMAAALIAWALGSSQVRAEEEAAPRAAAQTPADTQSPVAGDLPAFRRIFLPAADLDSGNWKGGYLPVDAEEFEQLLRTVRSAAADGPGAPATQIERAEYVMRLEGEDLLVGTAQWRLARRNSTPHVLMLDPCTLALHAATWQDRGAAPVLLGTGPDGQVRVAVDGADLQASCSLRGERTASGSVNFRLELPGAPISRMVLDAPGNLEVTADEGIVSRAPGEAKTNRWTIDLGGHNQINLRVLRDEAGRERRPLTLLRQSLEYEMSARGINVVAQLKFDVHGEPLQRIAVNLDPTLRLVSARYGELDVPWSATIDVETHVSHVVLQMPDPIAGTARVLQLSAIAPLTRDKLWRLPGLETEGMSWQEGTATLLIPNAFLLEQLKTDGCRQSQVTELPAPLLGESIQIQSYRPGASIEVLLNERHEPIKVETGALVEMSASEVTSRCTAQFSVTRGERRSLEFEVNPGWTVDSVENLGTKDAVDWELADEPAGTSTLKLRLETPVTAENPARLLVSGRRRLPSGGAFEGRQLSLLSFTGFELGARLISVRALEGSELRWLDSDDLSVRDVLEMTPAETQLFPSQPNGLLFVLDKFFLQAMVGIERRKANFTADIRIDAAVQKQSLTETYTIQCVPESTRVERLLLRFSHDREAPLEWNLVGGNSGQISSRKLSAGEQAQVGLAAGGEAWEIGLRLSRPGPFELRAIRSSPFTAETPLVLASLADAVSQRGTLAIRAIGDTGLVLQNRRLSSVPSELLENDRYQTARGTFHYQPSRDDLGAEPAVSIAPSGAAHAESGAWAWSSRLNTRYAADGACIHWATFRIQTAGQQQFRVKLPPQARLQSAWVDEQRFAFADDVAPAEGYLVELPSGRGFATLSLYYATPSKLPNLTSRERPPFAEVDIPVMARQWSVWLPPGYEMGDSGGLAERGEPRTWSQQLFGVLGRGENATVFNPLAASDWRETFIGGSETQSEHSACEQLALILGAVAADYERGQQPTWGQFLAAVNDVEAQTRRTLLIDTESLAWLGLTPQIRVRRPTGNSDQERGLNLLKENNLVLLAERGAILITTNSTAASYIGQLSEPEGSVLYSVLPGPLADELRAAMQGDPWSRFESVDSWRAAPEQGKSPWSSVEIDGMDVNDVHGWSAYTLPWSDSDEPSIRIVRTSAMRSLAWAVFLALVAVGLWKTTRHPEALVLQVSIAAAAAMLLPASYVPLASAALLAGLFCLAVYMMRAAPPETRSNDLSHGSVKHRSTASHPVATLLLAATLAGLSGILWASQPDPTRPNGAPKAGAKPTAPLAAPLRNPADARSDDLDSQRAGALRDAAPVYRVYVPVDDKQALQGGKYFVPEQFYAQLSRLAATAAGQPKGWIVTRGAYEGSLARDPVNKRLGLSQLKVNIDLLVFQPHVRVALPFARKELANPQNARLEGRPIELGWNGAGDELIVGALDAGRYRLELDLRPTALSDATTAGFDLTIPPLTNATLELAMPLDAPQLELPTARGEARLQKERDRTTLTAQLGPTNQLAVRWPAGSSTESAAPNLEVEELVWVKVRPGTTVVDAKFKYRVLAGRVTQIRLLTDPRLRLLPAPSGQSLVPHTIPGDPQKIDLELAQPVSDQVVVELSFLVTGASGVGNLRLPRLESSGARPVRRWLAVSVDPALKSRMQAGEDSRQLEVSEFTAAWGNADSKPLAAFGIPRGVPMWGLSTQPNEPHTTVEQALAIDLGRSSSRVQFDAVLNVSGGYLFQLELEAPQDLMIEQVSMVEDDVQRVSRWSTDEDGRVTVFLTAPVNGRQRLSLRGRTENTSTEAFAIPAFQVQGAEIKKNQLNLYRQASSLAEIVVPAGVTKIEPAATGMPEGFGSLLGCYLISDPRVAVSVTLEPNAAESHAVAATYLLRDSDRWVAEVDYHVDVTKGLADTLEFEVPTQWSEPYRIEPATPFKIIPVPGESRRRMIVYPDKPVQGKFHLKIRGRVALSAGDRLRVPDILPLRVQQVERFVVLPTHLDLQQVVWDTIGLARADLPDDFIAHGTNAQSTATYQVSGEHFQASLKAVERAGAHSHVRLADISIVWQPDGDCQGVAAFDLEPGTASLCVLELPPDYKLLHASVESLPALITPLGDNRWRLGLGPQQLPQRLEVVYTGPLTGMSGRRRFRAPRLVDLDVKRTLWTVSGPRQFGAGYTPAPQQQRSAPEHCLARLDSLAALVQLPAEIVGEHLPEEIVRWYQPWKKRYMASRAALDWQLIRTRQTSAQSEEALAARKLDNQMTAVDARLGLPSPDNRSLALADAPAELLGIGRVDLLPAFYEVEGPSHELDLNYKAAPDGWGRSLLTSLVMLGVGAVAAVFIQRRALPSLAPWLVTIIIGLVWWFWLTPSFIGLAVLLLGVWAALRTRWSPAVRYPVTSRVR